MRAPHLEQLHGPRFHFWHDRLESVVPHLVVDVSTVLLDERLVRSRFLPLEIFWHRVGVWHEMCHNVGPVFAFHVNVNNVVADTSGQPESTCQASARHSTHEYGAGVRVEFCFFDQNCADHGMSVRKVGLPFVLSRPNDIGHDGGDFELFYPAAADHTIHTFVLGFACSKAEITGNAKKLSHLGCPFSLLAHITVVAGVGRFPATASCRRVLSLLLFAHVAPCSNELVFVESLGVRNMAWLL